MTPQRLPQWIFWAISFVSAVAALALQTWDTRVGGSLFRTLDLESVGLDRIWNSAETVAWLVYYSALSFALTMAISMLVLLAMAARVARHRSLAVRSLALAGLAMFVQICVQGLASWLYPSLPTLEFARLLIGTPLGPVLVSAGLLLFAACAGIVLVAASKRSRWSIAVLGVVCVFISVTWPSASRVRGSHVTPNVILIGLDSFRPDLLFLEPGGELRSPTPAIRAMVSGGRIFSDTTTPFPRTYPATITVMTGRWPHRHGARENLYNNRRVSLNESLGARLSLAGYQTMFGMDEVRFANISAVHGYEDILSPRDGIVDFVAEAMASSAPLAILANLPPMRHLAPHIYGNRGLTAVYSPDAFVRRVRAGVAARDSRPLFLHLHLTLPHWPYRRDGADAASERWATLANEGFRPEYLKSLEELDAQFVDILDSLRVEKLLDDAVVLLYSDHGESFALARDAYIAPDGPTGSFDGYGHGSSVVSRAQVDALFSFQRFVNREPTIAAGADAEVPASLIDIAPTVLKLVGQEAPLGMDGRALWPVPLDEKPSIRSRVRVYEGPFPLMSVNTSRVELREVLAEALSQYTVSASGERVEFNEAAITPLLEVKHRAIEVDGWVLLRYRLGGLEVRESLVHRPTRRVWPAAPFPAEAPYEELSSIWCVT
jgi:arylsulfatase A-like enzyme